MASVVFDANAGTYSALAASDSQPYGGYEVSFDPMTDEFRCECPAFTYSRDRHCKHISRVGATLTDYVDSQDAASRATTSQVAGPPPSDTPNDNKMFGVSMNGGPELVLEEGVASWLVQTIQVGDAIEIIRVR